MNAITNAALTGALLTAALTAGPVAAGTLQFFASGEELATEGFQAPERTKDGWTLEFEHIYVTLSEVTAYQTNPPFDAHQDGPMQATHRVVLQDVHTVDLVADADDEARVLVAEAAAEPGHYNALSWRLIVAGEGPSAGTSMLFIGTAARDGQSVPFRIEVSDEVGYLCGQYVGDERKGFVIAGGVADLEMTFHLDHIFGREDKAAEDPMNLAAPGFGPFSDGAERHALSLAGLHVGHAGEGHCKVVQD